ncbi:alpha carbonic anhydrase 7-like [Olea europaea subsp. europaea]|uniref:Carbonic anhydrase n=2 Tax=Olea europaea subsp. europaea TaxID=158383 RepID=A0A8S0R3B5_OLEEU|nr:alpha carbonic anhydrase 7-like [Olea europaea subsp. europaea]
MKTSTYILASLLALLFLLGAKSVNAQEVEDEREFDYAKESEKGPRKWGELKKEWEACKDGKLQSPIDMSNERVRVISKPEKRIYKPFNATVRNRGHDISLRWNGDAGSILINGTEYPLRQAHWHSPSEHTINGRRYAMELHLVHQTSDLNVKNRIAVTGVFYKTGKPDKFLSKLMTNISSMVDQKDEDRNVGIINPKDIKMKSQRYYRYMGSLTVPPCTEGVIWTINTKVKTVSRDQLKLLREAVHDYAEDNARPLQPKHSRDIYLYGPGDTSD